MDEERNPWERLEGETISNYRNFCAYRDMCYTFPDDPGELPRLDVTPRRSLRKLAKQIHKTLMTLSDLSIKFQWQSRCEAYDSYILQRQRKLNEDRLLEMRTRHAEAGATLVRRGLDRLASLSDEAITPEAAVRMIDIGAKVESQSRGAMFPETGGTASGAVETIGADVRNAVEEAVGRYAGTGKDNSVDVAPPG